MLPSTSSASQPCRLPGCHVTPFSWLDPYYCQPSHREQHTSVTLVDEPDISWTNSTARTSDAPSWLGRPHVLDPGEEVVRYPTIGTEDL